jgi:hypothetical protein
LRLGRWFHRIRLAAHLPDCVGRHLVVVVDFIVNILFVLVIVVHPD